jgi:hypothetical protein
MHQTTQPSSSPGRDPRLTEDELTCMNHLLGAEMIGLKKCLHYAKEVQDHEARDLFRELADIHHRRIDLMLALLDAPPGADITTQAKLLLQTAPSEGGVEYHA